MPIDTSIKSTDVSIAHLVQQVNLAHDNVSGNRTNSSRNKDEVYDLLSWWRFYKYLRWTSYKSVDHILENKVILIISNFRIHLLIGIYPAVSARRHVLIFPL